MAYPLVDAPYGLKPINLIGGQVFAGSTSEYSIPYDYTTAIFYGDFVSLNRGGINRRAVSTGTVGTVTGIFLGCRYTNPVTKQLTFSQFWPGSLAAGDAVAIVCDDPDTVFKVAVCSATTVIASASEALIGQNAAMIDNAAGNVNTGNSTNALLANTASSAPATTAALPVRIVGLVAETAQSSTAVGYTGTGGTASSSTTITLTSTGGLPVALTAGTDVSWIAPNGQNIATGSYVNAAAAAAATTAALNQVVLANSANSSSTLIPLGSTIVFTQYTEALVKINFGQHQYYTATAIA
jgi:hypothetical protein